jgi:hypothetical protein
MEILDEVSNGNRIMPSLLRLLRQPNPQLRSKAVLMIGRSSRNVKWAQTRLGDADPRARANAVEALWGLGTIEAHAFLRAAVRDSNGRVAANALAGLYLLGDPWAIPELFKMGQSDSPMLRSSAAWAMGETGDRRFAEALGRMMCDASALVRKRVFSALGRIKSVAAQTRLGHQWRLATQVLPAVGGARRFSLEVALADGSALPQLLATQFLLTEAGQAVNAYQVEERLAPEVFSLSFILPRFERANAVEDSDAPVPPWVRGAMSCVAWKRRSDLWRVVFFREGKDPADPTPKTPNYTSMAETVAASLKEPPEQAACTDFWSVLREAVQPNTPIRGARQLIVYCPSDPGIPTDALEIISAAKAAGVVIQAIAGASNATLEDLCRRTHGKFRIALSTEDLRSIVEETYLTLLSRFDITYQPLTRGAASLHIRAANATGWGETTLAL